ncbi:MAG: MFS transporter [Parvibaculaceae bacterium]
MPDHPLSDHPPTGRRFFITGLGIGQICAWGSLYYSFPLIAEAMGRDLGWSKPVLYGAATVGLLLAGAASYPVGAAIDRGHGRIIMTASALLAGVLFILWSMTENVVVFYIAAAGLSGLQASMLYEPAFAVAARRFGPSEARDAITTLTLFGGFASTVFIPLVQAMMDGFGWRGALLGLGALNLVLCAGLHWLAIDPAKDRPRPAAPDRPPLEGRAAVAAVSRSPVFWLLGVSFVAYALAFSAFTYHLYPLLIERGLDAGTVVAIMAVIGPAQVAGRIVVRVFAPRAPVRSIGSVIVGIFPLVIAGFCLVPPDLLPVAMLAACYGAGNGVLTIVRGLAVPEMLTDEAYGAVNGIIGAPAQIMRALAPLLAAWLWAFTGSYAAVLLAILMGSIVMAASFWAAAMMARPPRKF